MDLILLTTMNNEQLIERIVKAFPDIQPILGKQCVEITVNPENLLATILALRTNKDFSFDYLFNLMGVDLDGKLGIYYHLESYDLKHMIVVKCFAASRENASIPSIMSQYPGVELLEREVFEFYGVNIEGHPDLRKLFLPEDWQGYPLRKDYYDPINIVER